MKMAYELKNIPIYSNHEAPADGPSVRDRDDVHLQRIGKKPVLKVRLCFDFNLNVISD